ncbi:MAG TPA: hypothetical protein VKB31_05815 [Trueperaceae bacterium]|nr:hypothetical protein [Trueperaceae bacterium]
MGRDRHQPLTPAEAKARLRRVARRGAGAAAVAGEIEDGVRRRPLLALGIALAAGISFGASRRVRAQVLSALVRLLE